MSEAVELSVLVSVEVGLPVLGPSSSELESVHASARTNADEKVATLVWEDVKLSEHFILAASIH